MNRMADDYDVWLDMLGHSSRPPFTALILDRAGVTLAMDLCQCLVHIDSRGPIGVLDLADHLDQNHPKVSRTLARLEELGLVRRAAAPYDRRIKTASVTEEGRRTVEAINEGRRRLLDEAFFEWSDHDRAELVRLTQRFVGDIVALADAHDGLPSGDRDASPERDRRGNPREPRSVDQRRGT